MTRQPRLLFGFVLLSLKKSGLSRGLSASVVGSDTLRGGDPSDRQALNPLPLVADRWARSRPVPRYPDVCGAGERPCFRERNRRICRPEATFHKARFLYNQRKRQQRCKQTVLGEAGYPVPAQGLTHSVTMTHCPCHCPSAGAHALPVRRKAPPGGGEGRRSDRAAVPRDACRRPAEDRTSPGHTCGGRGAGSWRCDVTTSGQNENLGAGCPPNRAFPLRRLTLNSKSKAWTSFIRDKPYVDRATTFVGRSQGHRALFTHACVPLESEDAVSVTLLFPSACVCFRAGV